jgi:hypothetical protein
MTSSILRAGVTGMQVTLVDDLELERSEGVLEQCLYPSNSIRGHDLARSMGMLLNEGAR